MSVVKILLILCAVAALYFLRDIVLVILTAVVLATAIEPGAQWLIRRRIPRIIAIVFIYLVLIVFIAGFFYLILPYVLDQLGSFMAMLPHYITTLDVNSGVGKDLFGWESAVQGLSQSESVGQAAQNVIQSMTNASGSLLITITTLFGGAVSLVLTLVISFYLSVQDKGIESLLKLITPLTRERYILSVWHRTQHKIGRWIQGQLVLALIVGVLVFIGLTILGVKNALFLAFISTVFEIIPVFGPFIGSVPGVLVGFLQGGLTYGIVVAVMYLIVQQIESNVIYPLVMRKVLDVPPLVVIIALIVGAKSGGFLGVLLSVPVAVTLTEVMNDIGRNRILAREKIREETI